MKEDIGQVLEHWGQSIPEKDFNFGINLFWKLVGNKKRGITKSIDLPEFLKECTYFMLKCGFDELKPKPLPTRPEKLLSYDISKAHDKTYEVKDSFWQDFEIRDYLEQKWKVVQHNMGNKAWLKENLTRLEQYGDVHYAQIVRNRIQEFEEYEQDNWQALKPYLKGA